MRIWKIATFALSAALIGSNGWWLLTVIDAGVTNKYQGQMMYERTGMLKQLISVIPDLSAEKNKNEIIAIVQKSTDLEPFEKEGTFWVGWTGLQFDDKDKLVKVIPSWGAIE